MPAPTFTGEGMIACAACKIINWVKSYATSCSCSKKAWKAAFWAA